MKFKFWKKLPAWLRGGIIGAIVAIIGIAIPFIIRTDLLFLNSITRSFIFLLFMPFHAIGLLLTLSGTFGCNFKMDTCNTEMIVGYILTVILFFAIGAFLSWMKSQKKLSLGILTLLLVTLGWIFLFWIIA